MTKTPGQLAYEADVQAKPTYERWVAKACMGQPGQSGQVVVGAQPDTSLGAREGTPAMTRFAKDTEVPVEKSRAEIERMIVRYGASATAFMTSTDHAIVCFEANERRVMFRLPLPKRSERRFTHQRANQHGAFDRPRSTEAAASAWEQACRQRWRALALVIKAKLEAVETGITTFEDEFLAHIVMPDGQTVGDAIKPRLKAIYETGTMQPLLPAPR
ncbi:hypothetical protein [Bradyrhizobium stylosanthis]|uniref:hypothetical protein n=1 Tax=Bradyrhizobium stylosanthis TaxID=1803665 RepID=UPI000A6D83EB|nr:hypothetical protein [Bradyrhizobium stylosanthis]